MAAIRCYCQRAGPTDPVGQDIEPFGVLVEDIAERPRGLPDADEADLLKSIQQGLDGVSAFLTLLSAYKQTILAVAKRCQDWQMRKYGYPVGEREKEKQMAELEAQGELGFVHAIRGYNPALCRSFASCAVECVKEAIGFLLLPGRAGYHGNLAN